MARMGSAIEAAIARITKRQIQPAIKEMRAAMKRMQRAIDKKSGPLRPGQLRGTKVNAGPPMSPQEVKSLRARLGMTQAEFARATGVTHVAVYYWESGRTTPAGQRLLRLRELEKVASGRAAKAGGGGGRKRATKRRSKRS